VTDWEYRKIDLNQQHPRGGELDLLNAAGAEGWELVGISSNNIAYVKRPLEDVPVPAAHNTVGSSLAEETGAIGSEKEGGPQSVKAKYRDPATNETWSGRGRMASWLKRKQDAGEDIGKYLT
jgi:hypothetical protein